MSERALREASSPVPSESELVRAARTGNQQAFGKLVERYQRPVCSLAYAFTGTFANSEEIAQEAFITAWKLLPGMRDPDRFRAWLYGIIHNVSRRYRRKERSYLKLQTAPTALMTDLRGAEPTPLDRVISQEEERVLGRALQKIPERYRIPIVLFYCEERSVEGIAEFLDLSETNVKQRLWRGRQLLHEGITEMLESALVRTRPRKEFVAAVLLAISAMGGGSAQAAPGYFRTGTGMQAAKILALAGTAAVALVGVSSMTRQQPRHATAAAGDTTETRTSAPLPAFVGAEGTHSNLPILTAPSAPREPANKLVFAFNFEDGDRPAQAVTGEITPCPPRAGNEYCLTGVVEGKWLQLGFSHNTTLFRYSKTLMVSFDYWIGKQARFAIQISADVAGTQYIWVHHPTPGVWTHFEAPLKDAAPINPDGTLQDGGKVMEDGDKISGLVFNTHYAKAEEFHIDNVTVSEMP